MLFTVLRGIFNNILMCLFETSISLYVRCEQFEIQMLFYLTTAS